MKHQHFFYITHTHTHTPLPPSSLSSLLSLLTSTHYCISLFCNVLLHTYCVAYSFTLTYVHCAWCARSWQQKQKKELHKRCYEILFQNCLLINKYIVFRANVCVRQTEHNSLRNFVRLLFSTMIEHMQNYYHLHTAYNVHTYTHIARCGFISPPVRSIFDEIHIRIYSVQVENFSISFSQYILHLFWCELICLSPICSFKKKMENMHMSSIFFNGTEMATRCEAMRSDAKRCEACTECHLS